MFRTLFVVSVLMFLSINAEAGEVGKNYVLKKGVNDWEVESRVIEERLKKQYPIEWFNERFGVLPRSKSGMEPCGFLDTDGHGEEYFWPFKDRSEAMEVCMYYNKDKLVDTFTVDQMISVLVHLRNMDEMRVDGTAGAIITEIKKNPDVKKYQEVKKFVNSRDYLMITDRGCWVFDIVDHDLPYYYEMVIRQSTLSHSGKRYFTFSCVNKDLRNDKYVALNLIKDSSYNFIFLSQRLKNDDDILTYLKDNDRAMFASMAYPESTKYHSVGHMSSRLQKKYKDVWLPENKKKFDRLYNDSFVANERKYREENKLIFKSK